ncbi:hypothetical protein FHS96_004375 [Sphingomonas zeicaulis]|uniref:hypothetical protein n=1 Tax=Sphingomonas zeicaulis TaxID=1632740 RepID=UPI003D21F31E
MILLVRSMHLGFTVAALIAATPTLAQAPADSTAAGEKRVCKTRPQTGTRFKKQTCRTAAEWEKIAEDSRRAAAEQINRGIVETRSGDGNPG